MKHGDFTTLAKNYIYRPAYSKDILQSISAHMGKDKNQVRVADIGAGTGKLSKVLLEMGFEVDAVEPNDSMRQEGINYTNEYSKVNWSKGSGEITNLDSGKYDWVTMASAFHWTDPKNSLPEFARILKDDGFLTIIWNPRDISRSPLHMDIEKTIESYVPNLKRVSSGSKNHTQDWFEVLTSTGNFTDVLFTEVNHDEVMTKDRYLGAWRSVNDIQVQAGEAKFQQILNAIEQIIEPYDEINVPYKMRAWTARKVK